MSRKKLLSGLHYVLFLVILVFGVFFRINNLSPFNLYPDSYQSLLVAKNIIDYHSVTGYLGLYGVQYPFYFSWSHPVFPLMIDFINIPTQDLTLSARFVAVLAGILAIPLAFLFIKRLFSSTLCGLAAALLLAFSFNHTVWGGFVMTETTGVMMILLFLLSFFSSQTGRTITVKSVILAKVGVFLKLFKMQRSPIGVEDDKKVVINIYDLLTGFLFVLLVLTRYEYALLLFPIILYRLQVTRLVTFLLASAFSIAFFVWQLYPMPSTLFIIQDQVTSLLNSKVFFILLLSIILLLFVLIKKSIKNQILLYLRIGVLGFIWGLTIFLLFQQITHTHILWEEIAALRNFVFHDILLSLFSIIGFSLLLQDDKKQQLGLFVFLSIVLLFFIYHRVNPDMERYLTHVIPFLLIPASYGFARTFLWIRAKQSRLRYLVWIVLISMLFYQGLITFWGMKYSQDASWYRVSYEDKAAMQVKQFINKKNTVLLTAYPEPYYYNTAISSQAIYDSSPYIDFDTIPPNMHFIIIEDMGMHNDFPYFTRFLDIHLQQYKIASFFIHEKFHYINHVQPEKYPVIVYNISENELQKIIKNTTK